MSLRFFSEYFEVVQFSPIITGITFFFNHGNFSLQGKDSRGDHGLGS